MAMKKRYHTVNGMLIGETSNGVRRGYLPDALGSVVATVDNNGAIENTYRYKPYGSLLAKTGTGDDPRFLWVGTVGYRGVYGSKVPSYVRSRHFLHSVGSWTSRDKLWPRIPAFVYVFGRPTTLIDPTGLVPSWQRQTSNRAGWARTADSGTIFDCPCCCDVALFELSVSDPVDNYPTIMYHDLSLSLVVFNRIAFGGERRRGCQLVWREKTDKPYDPNRPRRIKADQWFDVNTIPGIKHTDFKPPRSCPGEYVYFEKDQPAFTPNNPPEVQSRTICIRVELTEGCTGRVTVKTFWQIVITFPPLLHVIIGGAGKLEGYCNYP